MTNKTTSKKDQIVAEICFYGTTQIGSGYLISVPGESKPFGDSEPKSYRSFTASLYEAIGYIKAKLGREQGKAWAYSPDGLRRGLVDLAHPGYYGDIKWENAPVYEIEAAEIERLAQ